MTNAANGGIPFVITRAMKASLAARGFTPDQILTLTPAQAHAILRNGEDKKPSSVELTVFTKSRGLLTKSIELAADGTLVSDPSECKMWEGTATRIRIDSLDELAALVGGLSQKQAISLGALRSDLPGMVEIATKKVAERNPKYVARVHNNLVYNGPAYALLDFDSKAMSGAVAAELGRAGRVLAGAGERAAGAGEHRPRHPQLDQLGAVAQRHRRSGAWIGRRARLPRDQGRHRRRAVSGDLACALLAGGFWVGLDQPRRRVHGAFDCRPHGRSERTIGVRRPAEA